MSNLVAQDFSEASYQIKQAHDAFREFLKFVGRQEESEGKIFSIYNMTKEGVLHYAQDTSVDIGKVEAYLERTEQEFFNEAEFIDIIAECL